MSRYNALMNSHFSGCRLLHTGHDPHRNREVRFFLLPGEFDYVGISDTVDAWIAPVATPFMVKVREALGLIREGKSPPATTSRRRLILDEPSPEPEPRRRRAVIEEPQPTRRARHVLA